MKGPLGRLGAIRLAGRSFSRLVGKGFWFAQRAKEREYETMQLFISTCAGLALLILAVWLRGLLSSPVHRRIMRYTWRNGWVIAFRVLLGNLWSSELGVVAITYTSFFPNWGTSTPPTAAQASQLMEQTAEVFFADGDAQAVVIHNWGSLPGAQSWASFLHPQVWMYLALGGASPSSFGTGFSFGLSLTNSITINKLSLGAGSGGTYNVILRRPHSMVG